MPAIEKTALLIDFDNTISRGDVLDSVIERFSRTKQWIQWQSAWSENRISTLECLQRQIADLEVDQDTLLAHVRRVEIDPDFVHLQEWAAATGTNLAIASDNFEVIVREILAQHAIVAPPIFANALRFDERRVIPSFPYRSPTCARCANCKATHFSRFAGSRIIYVGDGLSDICPAMRADRVFAKDSLASYLAAQGKSFTQFKDLGEVVGFLWAGTPAVPGLPRPSLRS